MRPAQFKYHRPQSLQEAISLLAGDEESKALAGGHSLIPAMNLRLAQPSALVDIGRLDELREIRVEGGSLRIGALTTHAEAADSEAVRSHAPALAMATSLVGDPQVRSWGTLGGNLAHADPASDPPTVAAAGEGVIHIQGPGGKRSVAAGDFFQGIFATALEPGELITALELPSAQGKNSAYVKMAHPASRYALVGVCVILSLDGEVCSEARVAVGGVTHKPTRMTAAETALTGNRLDESTLENAAQAAMQELGDDLIGDHFAPVDYRRAMAGVYLKRAIRAARRPSGSDEA